MNKSIVDQWHEFIKTGNANILNEILTDDVVFHSPVVWTPQKGKGITKMYLTAAAMLLKNFEYQKEVVSENEVVLEFNAEIDGITINGIDMMTIDSQTGKISEFKVMIRPLQAVNKIHDKMAEMLLKMK